MYIFCFLFIGFLYLNVLFHRCTSYQINEYTLLYSFNLCFKSVLLKELENHKDLEAVLHHTFLKLHSGYTQWTKANNAGGDIGHSNNIGVK